MFGIYEFDIYVFGLSERINYVNYVPLLLFI